MTKSAAEILNDKSIWFTDEYINNFDENTPERLLMEFFAYGTWKDYIEKRKDLPQQYQFESDSNAVLKLKALTILTIMDDKTNYSFDSLMEDLDIDNFDTAETLVLELMGARLLVGKIDEKSRSFSCERVSSRCIPNNSESIQNILAELHHFHDKLKSLD